MLSMSAWAACACVLLGAGEKPAATGPVTAAAAGDGAVEHRVYVHLLEPGEHPDDDRRHVRPPGRDLFSNRTRFTCLRGFSIKDGKIVGYAEEIKKYTRDFQLGDVLWPSYPILFATNLDELVEEIKRRELFLFDIWGYVPGSGPPGYWRQFRPPPGVLELFESQLGRRWLGMDIGEQDGRYVGGYAAGMMPASAGRFEQYLNFQRHFERMGDELGNKLCTLVSLNFGHYFLKEGVYSAIGAETAQGLPNSQVYYAFIRGAGKQYGVPWFGNASVWNRWGYKTYGPAEGNHGPTKGTSLSLLKRLLYSHILYNCVFVGFEAGWFAGDQLSPIGRIQQAAREWVRRNGEPGTMVAPVAVMLDFFSGWTFPRHLYTRQLYRVWGNLPYDAGDHLTHGVLGMLYPDYEDSSYYHDERGFITATPYGDAADCILSDAPSWLLERYAVVVVAGRLAGGAELRDKLAACAAEGGHVVITAANLARLPGGLSGIRAGAETVRFGPGSTVEVGNATVEEETGFVLQRLQLPAAARVVARCGAEPAAVEVACGKGRVTVLASPYGVGAERATDEEIVSAIDKPLARPFPLLRHVRALLDPVFARQMLFEAGAGLSLITCRKDAGQYTLGVCNNSLEAAALKIVSHCGPIESVRELALDQSEKEATGYLPTGLEQADIGSSDQGRIAGGDVRIFRVRVREENVQEIRHVVPARRPRGRLLPLRAARSIKEEVLARPTFFQHFDGVVVDWRYVERREPQALGREAAWIGRQRLDVVVDLTSGVNLYPDLRLVDNAEEHYAASVAAITAVLEKMEVLGSHQLVLSLHRQPETNFTGAQTTAAFISTLQALCGRAQEHDVTLHLRLLPGKPPQDLAAAARLLEQVGADNLRLAPSIGTLLGQHADPASAAQWLQGNVALWFVSRSRRDVADRLWDVHAPIAGGEGDDLVAAYLAIAADAKMALDGVYGDPDAEYRDIRALEELVRKARER